MNEMNIAFVQLKRHEGFRAKSYKCSAGRWTIGYGHNIEAAPIPGCISSRPGDLVLSKPDAVALLWLDLQVCENQVKRELSFYQPLDAVRRAVLLNMCFNMGIRGLSKFRGTLACISNRQWTDAGYHMLKSLWARQVGARARELAEMMRTGTLNESQVKEIVGDPDWDSLMEGE